MYVYYYNIARTLAVQFCVGLSRTVVQHDIANVQVHREVTRGHAQLLTTDAERRGACPSGEELHRETGYTIVVRLPRLIFLSRYFQSRLNLLSPPLSNISAYSISCDHATMRRSTLFSTRYGHQHVMHTMLRCQCYPVNCLKMFRWYSRGVLNGRFDFIADSQL